MFTQKDILLLRAITPMHVGSGSDLGIVDLPIQRERHTGFPKIEGSSLKGAIREMFETLIVVTEDNEKKLRGYNFSSKWEIEVKNEKNKNDQIKSEAYKFQEAIDLVFGPENAGDNAYASAVAFTDARVLLFPVKSVKGVFAWITCPEVIERFCKDLEIIGKQCNDTFTDLKDNKIYVYSDEKLVIDGKVVLEEYTFDTEKNEDYFKFLEYIKLEDQDKQRVAIVSNDTFRDFVEMSTEVITRVKIGSSGTVEKGQLWTEEYLPAETILYSLVMTTGVFNTEKVIVKKNTQSENTNKTLDEASTVMAFIADVLFEGLKNTIFIGGNTTIGKGLTKVKFLKTDNNGNQQ